MSPKRKHRKRSDSMLHDNSHTVCGSLELCQCCLSVKDLKSIEKIYSHSGQNENYRGMLSFVFSEFNYEHGYICILCVHRLREAVDFKNSVISAQRFLHPYKMPKVEALENPEPTKVFLEIPQDNLNSNEYSSNEDDAADDTLIKTESETSEDKSDDFFEIPMEPPQKIFRRQSDSVVERKTLPYVLANTDRKCEKCHKEFGTYKELLDHMHEHYPNHICDTCGKICATRNALTFHTRTHSDVRINCKFCEKTFKNKSNLNSHVKVQHKGEKILYRCSLCEEVLNTYNARIKHLVEKHGREDKSYKCTQCTCKYRLSSHLRAHIRRVHLQEKKHKCQDCGAAFFYQVDLKKHLQSKSLHTDSSDNSKPCDRLSLMCTICNTVFDTIEDLQEHSKSHEETNCNIRTQCAEYMNVL